MTSQSRTVSKRENREKDFLIFDAGNNFLQVLRETSETEGEAASGLRELDKPRRRVCLVCSLALAYLHVAGVPVVYSSEYAWSEG